MNKHSHQWRNGAEMAVALIEALADDPELADRFQFDAAGFSAEENVLRSHLDRAIAGGSEVLEGFTQILSDYIASTAGAGLVPSAEHYREILSEPRLAE